MPPPQDPCASLSKRSLCRAALALPLAAWRTAPAQTERQPLRLVVGFPPGGITDRVARLLAEGLARKLGRVTIVENLPGAGGMIAARGVRALPVDERSLWVVNDHMTSIIPNTFKEPGYDTLADFAPVARVATYADYFTVGAQLPVQNLAGFLAWAHSHPAQASVGIPALGSIPHFTVSVLSGKLSAPLIVNPYRGATPLLADLLGGHIPAGTLSLADGIEHQRSGKLRLLACTGKERSNLAPDVPTYGEQGIKDLDSESFFGILMKNGTPRATQEAFAQAVQQLLREEDTVAKIRAMGMSPAFQGAGPFAGTIQATTRTWAAIVKKSGYALT